MLKQNTKIAIAKNNGLKFLNFIFIKTFILKISKFYSKDSDNLFSHDREKRGYHLSVFAIIVNTVSKPQSAKTLQFYYNVVALTINLNPLQYS